MPRRRGRGKTPRPILWGAAILTGAGVTTRAIGMVYRVFLARIAGAEALGLFQMVLPLYRMAHTTSTLGLPVSLARTNATRMSAGDRGGAFWITRLATAFVFCSTLLVCGLLLWGAPMLSERLLGNPRTAIPILALPLLLLPSSLAGTLRAFSQGEENMVPTAVAQVIEQLVRVPSVLWAVAHFAPTGVAHMAMGIVLGSAVGEVAGLLTILLLTRWGGEVPKAGKSGMNIGVTRWRLVRELFRPAGPLLASQWVSSLIQIGHMSLIILQLGVLGLDAGEAAVQYGLFSGMAAPVLFMPMVVVHPVVRVTVPAISRLHDKADVPGIRSLLAKIAGISAAVGVGAAAVLLTFSGPLADLLYNEPRAAPLMWALGFAAPFVYLHHVAVAALNGFGESGLALKNLLLATVIRFTMIYILVPLPSFGIMGAVWALGVDAFLSAVLNWWDVRRILGRMRPASG